MPEQRIGVIMVTQALLVRLHAQPGREEELARFLESAQSLVRDEPETSAWFALHLGHAKYGIFDAFPNEEGRDAHLAGAVAAKLMNEGKALLSREPQIDKVRVLASKMPPDGFEGNVTRGLLLTFKAKQGHEANMEQFLRDAKPMVDAESDTVAWFAMQLDEAHYGIFDVFPDNGARFAHLKGKVPRELTKHALSLLGGLPDMDMLDVLASNFAKRATLVGLGVD
jgi:quinol monooxygenase YgiN